MMVTIKRSVAFYVTGSEILWDQVVAEAVFGYCRRRLRTSFSPSELLYDINPNFLAYEQHPIGAPVT